MAGDNEKLVQEYQQMNKTAFVVGYTGEVGKALVHTLLSNRVFAKVVLIGRRTVTYEDELYKDVVSSYYMIIEPVHLLPEVKCQCNRCIIVYLKSVIGNYSIAGKRGQWPAFEDISLPYLTLP